MSEKFFLEKIVDIADIENEITMDTILADLEEWDSLSLVSFIAFAKASGARDITVGKVREAETIRDLYELLNL